jgi:hypothetical protein
MNFNKLTKPVKYDSFELSFIEKLYKMFNKHSQAFNKKHEQYVSDRDRFVKKLFNKYVNKTFIFIDKIPYLNISKVGDQTYASFLNDKKSIYCHSDEMGSMMYEQLYKKVVKRYLVISSFDAVNTFYGNGYIQVTCYDEIGTRRQFELCHNNLLHMQFKEIDSETYHAVAALFADNRKDEKFKIVYHEILGSGKYKKKKLIVLAKDADDVRRKFENETKVILSIEKELK